MTAQQQQDLLAIVRAYGNACASTARTPPNSPARHAAARIENDRWSELEPALRAVVAERDALRARITEIETQEPVLEVKKRGCEVGVTYGGCVMAGYGALPVGTKLYARPVPAQAVPDGWRPIGIEPEDGGLYWVLIGDQPHVARFSTRTSTARWWSAYGIPRAVAEEPTHWMPIPDAPEAAR